MTNEELLDNIIGLMAYDKGCVSSGIHDEVLKEQCKTLVDERSSELVPVFTAYVHRITAPDSGGYTIEDAASFIRYLSEEFDWSC